MQAATSQAKPRIRTTCHTTPALQTPSAPPASTSSEVVEVIAAHAPPRRGRRAAAGEAADGKAGGRRAGEGGRQGGRAGGGTHRGELCAARGSKVPRESGKGPVPGGTEPAAGTDVFGSQARPTPATATKGPGRAAEALGELRRARVKGRV